MKEIHYENRRLLNEADEYKATDICKKVTALYEKEYDEIQKFLKQQVAAKEIGSIYTYLFR